MKKPNFEIGITYKKRGKSGYTYFVAVSEQLLATWEHGEFVEKKIAGNFRACRNLPVEALCRFWDIKVDDLDKLSEKYFTPNVCRDMAPSERGPRQAISPTARAAKLVKLTGKFIADN